MKTPLYDGIQKKAILDIMIPGGYGYYAHAKGKKPSDTAVKGALIGGGVETLSSIGDIVSGDVDLNTLTSPVKGALRGGVSALTGQMLLPLLLHKLKTVDWSQSGKKALTKGKKLLDKLDDVALPGTN